ncbi:MAG TPA: hypothetical protein DEB06_09095 [Phycisphaerales bacterium]|nr:hypothetical protein [Phycisphaerales bacterium]
MSGSHVLAPLIAAGALSLGACSSPAPPTFRVASVAVTDESPEAAVLTFRLLGENTSDRALPLRTVSYTLALDGRPVFQGERSAEVTLNRFGAQSVDLPVTLLTGADRPALEGEVPYTLSGSIVYEVPGTIAEVLFDARLRRPSAGFSQSGRLDFSALDRPITGPMP